jgi:hypothetical protein
VLERFQANAPKSIPVVIASVMIQLMILNAFCLMVKVSFVIQVFGAAGG